MKDRIEENIEVIFRRVEKEVGVGAEKDHFQEILIIGKTLDQGQDQEQVKIEIELGVINIENMIILQKIALYLKKKERQSKSSKCLI